MPPIGQTQPGGREQEAQLTHPVKFAFPALLGWQEWGLGEGGGQSNGE